VPIPPATWHLAVETIRTASTVCMTCHVDPDGDALGSLLALNLYLRGQGIPTVAGWSEPMVVPHHYDFLPGLSGLSAPEEFPESPEVLVSFDAGSMDRLGSLAPNVSRARTIIVLDHHASSTHFGHINVVDPHCAASAVLTHRLIREMGGPLDADIATCLYTGLITDTGRFQYQSTTPGIHRLASELLSFGIDHAEIARRVFETHSLGYLKVLAGVLDRIVQDSEGRLTWSVVTQADLKRCGVRVEDTEGVIDVVRTAEETDVTAVIKETVDGHYRVSLRSKGKVNVGRIAETMGGGGHANAAGFTAASQDLDALVATLRALIPA